MTFEELDRIAEFDTVYTGSQLKMTSIEYVRMFSTNDIKVHRMYIGLNPESSQYGDMIGIIEYQNRFYRFRFHIHRPNQGSPHLSNKMTCLDSIHVQKIHDIDFVYYSKEAFGEAAFWTYMPLETLKQINDGSYELRLFMQKLIEYSRREKLCQRLRKTDKQHIAYKNRS